MSRIEDLIAVLAHREIGRRAMAEVFDMRAGGAIAAAEIVPVQDSDHPYPCYGGNGTRGFVAHFSHDGDFLLVGRQGALSGNVKRARGHFYATEHAVVFASRGEIDVGWAFHMLTAMNLNQYVSQGAQPGLAVRTLARVEMPVPPVEVQREIVQVLDLFTELESELRAELEARQRQYAYYRGSLLTFEGTAVQRIPLGELACIVRGASPRPIHAFITDAEDGVPWIKIGDVAAGGKYITSTAQRVTPEGAAKSRRVYPGDFVLSNSMSFGRPYISKIEGCIHDGWLAISEFDESFVPDFLYHLLRSAPVQAEFARRAGAGAVQNLNVDIVKSVVVPVPSIDEQERIAWVLDKFEMLVNDISVGLPAELNARRKQYEYYRDRLLTFEELAA